MSDSQKIEEILSRSIAEVLPTRNGLREALMSGKRLRVYIGTDATGTSLHLGHATNYMLLEKLRRLGHEVIFLVGDFTARIGDPTDKGDAARKQLTREQVVEHVTTWIDQVKPVIDVYNKENPVKILYNHDWLAKLTFEDVISLASNFTVQQMIERDMFQERIKSEKPLYLHELFYPLMQGYDSVAMDVDVEVCGMDQKFNALAGRTLQRKLNNKEKFVLITTLLENPVTGKKMMSKSLGTGVFLDADANTMYGGVMAQADENMKQLFTDCTWLGLDEIATILETQIPRDAKMRLAFEITKIFHREEGARGGEEHFSKVFQKKEIPDDILEIKNTEGVSMGDLLVAHNVVESKAEWRRLVESNSVKKLLEGASEEKITDPKFVPSQGVYKIGKRRFVKIV